MLYWLNQLGLDSDLPLRIFGYITVRAALALALALIVGIIVGPLFIGWLKKKKIGQQIRGEGIPDLYERHKEKADTPTMGGILILSAFIVAVLVCGNLGIQMVWITILAAVGFGAIGALDDWSKVSNGNHKGISAKTKLLFQAIVALTIAIWIYNLPEEHFRYRTNLDDPIEFVPHSITTLF